MPYSPNSKRGSDQGPAPEGIFAVLLIGNEIHGARRFQRRQRQLPSVPRVVVSLDRSWLLSSVLSLSLGSSSPPWGSVRVTPRQRRTERQVQELRSDVAPQRSADRGRSAPPSAAPVLFPTQTKVKFLSSATCTRSSLGALRSLGLLAIGLLATIGALAF